MIASLLLLLAQAGADPLPGFTTLLERALAENDARALYAATDAGFQQAVGLPVIRGVLQSVRNACGTPLALEIDPPRRDAGGFQHLIRAAGPQGAAVFRVNFDAQGLVEGLLQSFEAPVWSEERLEQETAAWGGDYALAGLRFNAAAPEGAPTPPEGAPTAPEGAPMYTRAHGRTLFPLGSIFKVYVLAEFARRLDAGEFGWDQTLELREEWKSLPSGTMQDEPAGSAFPLREYVHRMIAISDNTATDHLLRWLGRESVEAGLKPCCNSVPERNQPFLTTQELFWIKGVPQSAPDGLEPWACAWRDGTPESRRAQLDAARAAWAELEPDELRSIAALGYSLRTLQTPAHLDVEWLAAPADIVALYRQAALGRLYTPGASAAFRTGLGYGSPLYQGPGVVYQGFKGGSETGVFALSLLLQLDDGTWAAVCVCRCGFPPADPKVPQQTVAAATALARALLEGRVAENAPQR